MDVLTKRYFTAMVVLVSVILYGCAPELRRPDASQSAVQAERTAQIRLAKSIRSKRLARLNKIREKLIPHARDICSKVLDKSGLDCLYSLELVDDSQLNAAADGEKIYINSGLIRFLESDDEIAIVIGHEMAHNMLDHSEKKMGGVILGAIVDGVIQGATGINTGGIFQNAGALVYSKDYEEEADYLGLYLASRAGYDISIAPTLWRRMGAESPGSIAQRYGGTHPGTPERSVALQKAVAEVEIKKSQGLVMLPNRADGNTDTSDVGGVMADSSPAEKAQMEPSAFQGKASNANDTVLPTVVGEWNYRAENYAEEQGCLGEDRRRPVTMMVKKEAGQEHFTSACSNRDEPFEFACSLVGCSQ